MNDFSTPPFWILVNALIRLLTSAVRHRYGRARVSLVFACALVILHITQEGSAANVSHLYKQNVTVFEIADDEALFLDDAFCLRSITVKSYLTNDVFVGEYKPSMRLDIRWESEKNVTSLGVTSDSLNDSYCDARDRFSYHKKSIKNNMHTFPDIVNYGPRYVPIKLDCKYTIMPELPLPCLPVRLKYTAPVCLAGNVCSCRNVSLPAPKLKVEPQTEGVTILWEAMHPINTEDIHKICISVKPAELYLSYSAEEVQIKEFGAESWENIMTKSGKCLFPLNSTYTKKYVVKAIYENSFECSGNFTQLFFDFPEITSGSKQILAHSLFYFFIIVAFMTITLYFFRRKLRLLLCNKLCYEERRVTEVENNNEESFPPRGFQDLTYTNNPLYTSYFQDKDLFVIDYRQLIFKRKLAEGHFGVVYLASSPTDIKGCKIFAVKQLKDTATSVDVEDFLQEMNIFKNAGVHPHIVRMIGYSKMPQPLSIVMEYIPYNLLEYLKKLRGEYEYDESLRAGKPGGELYFRRSSRETLPSDYITADEVEIKPLKNKKREELECSIDNQELESFSLQIARGMAHLEEKSIVHRDLAARNVLIDKSKTLKISDFGMSRTGTYVNKTNRQFPLRWMSPEAVTNGTFSNKSDVWSYGVVLWEIGTLGGFPYSDFHNDEVFSYIKKGGHPDQPESVTARLYHLMLTCWRYKPEDRPNFAEIVKKIENLRQKAYVDFASLKDYYAFPPTEEEFHSR